MFSCKPNLCSIDRRGAAAGQEQQEKSSLRYSATFFYFFTRPKPSQAHAALTDEGPRAQSWSNGPLSFHRWPSILESETNPALAQKSRQMWFNKVFLSQLCFGREPGCLVTWTLLEDICFNFRLASSPRMSASDQMRAMLDQLMGTQRNGESQNPPDQEVIPQFNTNLNPCQIPISVGCLKFFFIWLLASNKLYFPFLFISDPTLCNTWKFIFLGQIFCENSDSLRWYVILLIHKSLFPGIQEKKIKLQSKILSAKPPFIPGNLWKRHWCHIIVKSVRIWYEKKG